MNMWKYFKIDEFKCKHCGLAIMDERFVDRLDTLRGQCGFPLRITSGYRCPEHNDRVSSTGRMGPHTTGRAVDVSVDGKSAYRLIQMATELGFTGIGVQQKGPYRFIHLDDLEANETRPRPSVWSY